MVTDTRIVLRILPLLASSMVVISQGDIASEKCNLQAVDDLDSRFVSKNYIATCSGPGQWTRFITCS